MRPQRPLPLVLALCTLALLLLGTSDKGCTKAEPDPLCPLVCEVGFKHDSEGNRYCECREAEVCILVVPPPHRDPVTNKCVLFPTPCDVPRDWDPCDPGDGQICSFDEDCPKGSHCEGSSVCPKDVVCVWEGKPGVCVPDLTRCCEPSLRPGAGDNPLCFEGARCCASGHWQCNAHDGSSTCEAPGLICER